VRPSRSLAKLVNACICVALTLTLATSSETGPWFTLSNEEDLVLLSAADRLKHCDRPDEFQKV
jgi:hypothetical protein